jgi:mono/diheme cytochrome c family protein
MKLKNFFPFLFFIVAGLVLVSFSFLNPVKGTSSGVMPDNVKAAIDKSCFGCHNTDAQNPKPKEKLDFKTLDTLSKTDKISRLNNIAETVKKGEMPPKKFLERFPDKKLTPDEQKAIAKWVKREIKNLMKK